jgi:Tol biopolymer transport system component
VLRTDEATGSGNIYARKLHGDTALVPLVVNPTNDFQISLSPDGTRLAYTISEAGLQQLFVAAFPSMASAQMVSRGGGGAPRWAHSGRELFFESQGRLMVAPSRTRSFRWPAFARRATARSTTWRRVTSGSSGSRSLPRRPYRPSCTWSTGSANFRRR